MTAIEMLDLLTNKTCGLFSTERPGKMATRSERKRWLVNRAVRINGTTPKPFDEVGDWPPVELVLFYKSKSKTSIF